MQTTQSWPGWRWGTLVAVALVTTGARAEASPPSAPVEGDPAAWETTRWAFDPVLPLSSCAGGGTVLTAPAGQGVARVEVQFDGDQSLGDRAVAGGWCPGYATAAPQLCLRVSRGGLYALVVTDSQTVDTVMALVDHDDSLQCDDDSAGDLRPSLTVWLEPGAYAVWVGPYSSGNTGRARVEVSPQ